MNIDDYIEERKKKLGVGNTSTGTSHADEYIQNRKMDLGLVEDTRPRPTFQQTGDRLGLPSIPDFSQSEIVQLANENALLKQPQLVSKDSFKTITNQPADRDYLSNKDFMRVSGSPTAADTRKQIANYEEYTGTPISPADRMAQSMSDFVIGATNSAALGIPNAIARRAGVPLPEESTAGKVGEIAGMFAPGSLAFKGASAALRPLIENAPKLVQTLARGAAAGTAYEGAVEGADAALDTRNNGTESFGQRAANIGIAAGIGAAGDAAFAGLGSLIKKYPGSKLSQAVSRYFGRETESAQPPIQEQGPTLALPAGRPRGNVNSAETPDIIYGEGKVEPIGLPEPNVLPPTRARMKTRANPYEQKLNRLFEVARNSDLPPGREREALEDLWSRMADRDDPGLDDLIDLAYPKQAPKLNADSLSRARELQRMREVSGAGMPVSSFADRYPQGGVHAPAASPVDTVRIKPATSEPRVIPATNQTKPQLAKEAEKAIHIDAETEPIIKSTEPRIRDKVYSFLDDAEKAARERLKAKRNTLSSNPIDQYADYAIVLAAKIGKGTIKLADATEYLVKEFGEGIRPHAQAIYNRARSMVSDAERRATKEAREARDFNAADTGDSASFRSKVNRGGSDKKSTFAQKWEKWRTQTADDLAPLEGLEKRVRGKVASAESSLYKAARLFRGVPEKANQIVKQHLAPVIDDIEKKGYTSEDLGDYALAVHAKDVNARDIKSGFTDKEIDDVIKRLGTPEMEAARQELMKINDDMLAELAKNGVIDWQLVGTLRERYKNYMPLFRAFDDESVNFADGLSKALANVTAPIKTLKGSERQVIDPFENMVKNIFQSTNAAERNKVARQLSKLATEDKDANFIRKLDDGEEVGRKNVVSVLENGKKVQYEVEPEVYKAMLNLDQESSNMLIKILQKPASVLRAGATLTPEFSLRNPMRDVLQAFVTSESGFNPLTDFTVGLVQSISKGKLYQQWIDELGGYGNIISNDRKVHQEALEKVLKESAGKKFVNVINGKSLVRILRAISDTTESATKVGEFRAAIRKGTTPQEAAYRSRDLMDFGRAGSSIRQTNKIVAFLNANIQGKSKLIRAFKANPIGTSARAFSAVTVPTVGAFLMQKYWANDEQKQTIDESPQWLKDSFWLIPVPGTSQVARIPKPFDLGAVFSNLPERALEFTYNNDKKAFDNFAQQAASQAALPGMISGLLPFIEGMANYSFFREGPIIPRSEQDSRKLVDQYDVNSTETAKFLAKGASSLTGEKGAFKNFSSPRIMDSTIKGLTAGLGTYATSAIDVLLDKLNISDNPARPEKGAAQKPLAKAFLVNPLQSGESTEKLYELKEKLTREKGSAEINEKPFKDTAKLTYVESQTKAMGDINKQIKAIENNKSLTPKLKREQIERLLSQRNTVAINAMKKVSP